MNNMKMLFITLLLVALASCHYTRDHDHDHDHDHDRDHDHDHDHGYGHYHDHDHGHGHGNEHSHNHDEGAGAAGPVVRTAAGVFRGGFDETRYGRRFESYRGIRYAAPPVGELRFQPPRLIERYPSPVDAREDGPACPQPTVHGYFVSEDCLMLNVYTPLKKDRKGLLPVIVFIHAGGFYSMTGRSDLAGPHYLLDRDIVLVTINYRIGSLGFLSTGDELAPGNNGFKDQVAALKWVQRNIAGFGGDRQRVTIAGCSAGSYSVILHMISPMSKGLFHRGISMSGSPIFYYRTPDNMYRLAVKQAELMNCPTNNSRVIIDCLKTKPWRELGDSLRGFYEFGFRPLLIWEPVVEKDFGQERFLTMNPVDAIKQSKMHAVPYIVSQTTDEFFWMAFTVLRNQAILDQMNDQWESVAPIYFLLPRGPEGTNVTRAIRTAYLHDRPLRNDEEGRRGLRLLYADSIESFPTHRLMNLMCRHSPHPVWYYEFAYIGNHSHYEDPITNKPIGAAHHDDLIYLFSLSYRFPDVGRAGADARLADLMTALWHNFAAHGDPNYGELPELQGVKWPAVLPDKRSYLRVDSELSVRTDLKEDRIRVWEELFPLTY